MELIIGTGTVVQASRDTMPATGTPGWATDGDPAASIPATDFPASHYNMTVAEMVQVILDAGLTLDRTNWGQLSAAIRSQIAAASASAATNLAAEAAARSNGDAALQAEVASRIDGTPASGDYAGSKLYQSSAQGRPHFYYTGGDVYLAVSADITSLNTAVGNEAAARANADAAIVAMLSGYLPLDGGGTVTGDTNIVGNFKVSGGWLYTDNINSYSGGAITLQANLTTNYSIFVANAPTDKPGSTSASVPNTYWVDEYYLPRTAVTSSVTTDSNGNPVIIETNGGVKTQSFIAINLVDKETITYPQAFSGAPTVQLTPIYGASIGTGGSTILANLATTPGNSSFQIDLRSIGGEDAPVTTGVVVHVVAKGAA